MQTFSLTNIWVKFISVLFFAEFSTLFISILIWFNQMPWFFISIFGVMVCISLICCVVVFKHKLVLDKNKRKLIIGGGKILIKNLSVDIDEISYIQTIEDMVAPKRFATIKIQLKNGKSYNTLGYSSVFHKNDAYKTQKIVEKINEELIKISTV